MGVLGDYPHGMGDGDYGGARFVQAPDQVHHAPLLGVVEAGGRLVQDQDLRPHSEHRGDRDPLALAFGQPERVFLPASSSPTAASASETRSLISSSSKPRTFGPKATSSKTVSEKIWWSGFWKT